MKEQGELRYPEFGCTTRRTFPFELASFLLSISGLVGCAKWYPLSDTAKKPEVTLPLPRMSPDAVAIEAVFLRLDEQSSLALGPAWLGTNEQAIDIQTRRRLDANGIRAGVITGRLPVSVQRWVEETDRKLKTELDEQADFASDVSSQTQRLVCRAGRSKPLRVRSAKDMPLVLLLNDGEAKGKTYDQAELMLDLKLYPNPDGTANLRITPEVHYGFPRPVFQGQELGIRREFRKPSDSFKESALEVRLSQGQVLMMSGTELPVGLGESFFWADTSTGKRERTVLLIRLAQTQLDSLFAPEAIAASHRAIEAQ